MLAATSFALAVFASNHAQAYCRTMSCELRDDPSCERDAHQCVIEGVPLHWASSCLTFAVQEDGSPSQGIDADRVAMLVEEAFAVWSNVECPGGGQPSFVVTFQGFVSCDRRETVCAGGDENVSVIMFHDQDWPNDPSEIGLTHPSGVVSSGLVVDADMEINARDYDFYTADDPEGETYLDGVIAHEVGHFLGLAHSDASDALMYARYHPVGAMAGLLTADDVAGICAAFPPGQFATCDAAPVPAFDECVGPGAEGATDAGASGKFQCVSLPDATAAPDSGCAVTRRAGPGSGGTLLLWAGVAGLLGARRRRA